MVYEILQVLFIWSCPVKVGCALNTGSSISVGFYVYRRTFMHIPRIPGSTTPGSSGLWISLFLYQGCQCWGRERGEGSTRIASMALSSHSCSCPGKHCTMSIYPFSSTVTILPHLILLFSFRQSFIVPPYHLVYCHSLFQHLCFVQSCLRVLVLSRPLRPSPENVLVAATRVPTRATLVLCSLMMPLTCQLNKLTK